MNHHVLCIDIDDVDQGLLAEAKTPVLDALREGGTYFSTFWAGPNCSGYRARVHSGRSAFRTENLIGTVIFGHTDSELPVGEHCLPKRLPGRSVHRGKWHLSRRAMHPIECGYAAWSGSKANLTPGSYTDWKKTSADEHGSTTEACTGYATTEVVEDALMDVQQGTPFVHVSMHAAHKPLHVPPRKLYHQESVPTSERGMAVAMLEAADTELDRLLRTALEKDYLILLSSDNGAAKAVGGRKRTLFENGVSTFLIAAGKGIAKGRECAALTQAEDLYATIVELRGGEHSSPDATSLVPILFDGADSVRDTVYTEKFKPNAKAPANDQWDQAVRGERFKLIRARSELISLYDLQEDPAEENDLTEGELSPEASAAMTRLLAALPKG